MLSTLKDCAEFCHKHQRRRSPDGKVIYRDLNEWARIIIDASKRNKLFLVEDANKRLIGVCVMTESPARKVIWVHDIVCISNAFATFIHECFKRFPGYTIAGNRFNKLKHYTKRNLWAATNQV